MEKQTKRFFHFSCFKVCLFFMFHFSFFTKHEKWQKNANAFLLFHVTKRVCFSFPCFSKRKNIKQTNQTFFDFSCFKCEGTGKFENNKCGTCRGSGWIELGGCGMVHPNVLKNCAVDHKVYSGFAFGFGLERMCALMYSLDDIRLMFENDIRFLKQFR